MTQTGSQADGSQDVHVVVDPDVLKYEKIVGFAFLWVVVVGVLKVPGRFSKNSDRNNN